MSASEFEADTGGSGGIIDTGTDQTSNDRASMRSQVINRGDALELSTEMRGFIEILRPGNLLGEPDSTYTIRYTLDTPSSLRDRVNEAFNQIDSFNLSRLPNVPSSPRGIVPDELRTINSDSVLLAYSTFGTIAGGEEEVEVSKQVPYQRVRVPVTDQTEGFSRDLPNITLRVDALPSGNIERLISNVSGNNMSITLEIPPAVFIEEVNVTDIPCEELLPDVQEAIDRMRSRFESARSSIASGGETIEDARQELTSRVSRESVGDLSDISLSDVSGLGEERLRELKTNVQSVEMPPAALAEARSALEEARDNLPTDEIGDCVPRFRDAIEEIRSRLSDLRDRAEELATIKERILDLLNNISRINCSEAYAEVSSQIDSLELDIETAGTLDSERIQNFRDRISDRRTLVENQVPSDSPCRDEFLSRLDGLEGPLQREGDTSVDCSDVSRSIRNEVSGFESTVDSLTGRGSGSLNETRIQAVLDDGRRILDRIDSQVSSENPCKSDLRSRVRNSLSELRNESTRLTRPQTCGAKYPRIDGQVDAFEEAVLDLGGSVNEAEIEQVTAQSEEVIQNIESTIPAGDQCRSQYLARVNAATDQIGRRLSSVRVRTQIPEETRQRAQDSIQQLRQRVNDIIEGGAGLPEAGEGGGINLE